MAKHHVLPRIHIHWWLPTTHSDASANLYDYPYLNAWRQKTTKSYLFTRWSSPPPIRSWGGKRTQKSLSKERDLKAKLKSTSNLTHLVKEWALTLRNSRWLQQMGIYPTQSIKSWLSSSKLRRSIHNNLSLLKPNIRFSWPPHEKVIPPASYF